MKDVKRAFRSALKDAGIKNFRFHDLRHTFGPRSTDRGALLKAIRDTLGKRRILEVQMEKLTSQVT